MYEYIIETETPLSELKTFPNCKETWAFSKANVSLVYIIQPKKVGKEEVSTRTFDLIYLGLTSLSTDCTYIWNWFPPIINWLYPQQVVFKGRGNHYLLVI